MIGLGTSRGYSFLASLRANLHRVIKGGQGETPSFYEVASRGIGGKRSLIAPRISCRKIYRRRPNFLFMIADDLTYRGIRALFDQQVSTPNLDRLVANGCSFTHCFQQGSWTGAVCIASRTMLLTGLTTFRAEPVMPSPRCDFTPLWGQTLREAGYHTYMVGKWHLDPTMMQRCFEEMGPIGLAMFQSVLPDAYHRPAPGNTWTPWDERLEGHWIHTGMWQNSPNDEVHHSCRVWADCAVDHLLQTVPS